MRKMIIYGNAHNDGTETVSERKRRAWLPWAILGLCILTLAGSGLYLAGCFRPRTIEGLISVCKRRPCAYPATLKFGFVAVGDRMAEYHEVKEVRSKDLVGFPGEPYADGIYRPKGRENLQHLISRQSDGKMSLWVFSHYIVTDNAESPQREFIGINGAHLPPPADCSPYTYADAARVFYGLKGPEDIAGITVLPPGDSGTQESKAIREEIGTRTVTDETSAAAFYGILTRAICRGATGRQGYLDLPDRFTYRFLPEEPDRMRAERHLRVTLVNGTVVDTWRYEAIKGCFYQTGGICTEPLDEADVRTLNGIFGIE